MLETSNWEYVQRLFLDTLFPPTQRTQSVRNLTEDDIANLPPAESPPDDNVFALFEYADKTVRQIVQATKYDGCRYGARIMGYLLHDHLLSICTESRVISGTVSLVPVPLSRKRKQKRGFNQCDRIIKHIYQHDNGNAFAVIHPLEKPSATTPQATLSRTERRENITGSFQLNDDVSVAGKNIIIIDDVTTTGATFAEARKTLQAGNPESIHAIAFAH